MALFVHFHDIGMVEKGEAIDFDGKRVAYELGGETNDFCGDRYARVRRAKHFPKGSLPEKLSVHDLVHITRDYENRVDHDSPLSLTDWRVWPTDWRVWPTGSPNPV